MIDSKFTCAAQLCAFCCALSSVASSLPVSAGLLHTGFIVTPAPLYITPRSLGNTFLSVAECSECSLLNKVCSKYVALLQVLCSDLGHGFSIGKVGETPKDLGVVMVWEEASLACRSICLHSQASEMPYVGPERRDYFFLKQCGFRKWIFIVAWTFFAQIIFRKLVGEFVWPG